MRDLSDSEILSIRPGDHILECGQWCRVETVSFSESASGWPIANVRAVDVENPLFRASLSVSRDYPARRLRLAVQSKAA